MAHRYYVEAPYHAISAIRPPKRHVCRTLSLSRTQPDGRDGPNQPTWSVDPQPAQQMPTITEFTQTRLNAARESQSEWWGHVVGDIQRSQDQAEELRRLCLETHEQRIREQRLERQRLADEQQALLIRRREELEERYRAEQLRFEAERQRKEDEARRRYEEAERRQQEARERIRLQIEARRSMAEMQRQERERVEGERRQREQEAILQMRERARREREETERRIFEEQARLQRHLEDQREAHRLAEEIFRQEQEEAEARRRERFRECVVCLERDDMDSMRQAPCQHWYCHGDIRGNFQYSTPFISD